MRYHRLDRGFRYFCDIKHTEERLVLKPSTHSPALSSYPLRKSYMRWYNAPFKAAIYTSPTRCHIHINSPSLSSYVTSIPAFRSTSLPSSPSVGSCGPNGLARVPFLFFNGKRRSSIPRQTIESCTSQSATYPLLSSIAVSPILPTEPDDRLRLCCWAASRLSFCLISIANTFFRFSWRRRFTISTGRLPW